MPDTDSLKRLGGGRWETRDGRFAIEPQSGTWVIVDNEQTDELGLPLVRGPFGSLTAAREAIDAARTEGPAASPLAERIEHARQAEAAKPKAASLAKPAAAGTSKPAAAGASKPAGSSKRGATPEPPEPTKPPKPEAPAEPPPKPKWLRDLAPADQRRARDLIARLEKLGVADPERVVRSQIAEGQPALARLALERAIAKAVASAKDTPGAVRAAVRVMLRGADVELGTSWRLVDDEGRRIEKLDVPE